MMVAKEKSLPLYLGVDPGSRKMGLALLNKEGTILRLHIARMGKFSQELNEFCGTENVVAVILGNGTHSKAVAQKIELLLPELPIHFVEEAYSTEEARKLYWKENPPQGLKKLVPLGLLVPDEPLDAYAAVVQVRRWLKDQK